MMCMVCGLSRGPNCDAHLDVLGAVRADWNVPLSIKQYPRQATPRVPIESGRVLAGAGQPSTETIFVRGYN